MNVGLICTAGVAVGALIALTAVSATVLREYERGVVFRMGRA